MRKIFTNPHNIKMYLLHQPLLPKWQFMIRNHIPDIEVTVRHTQETYIKMK